MFQVSTVLDSVLVIFSNDSLRAGRSGDRISVKVRFFLIRPDRQWDHPDSCAGGTRSQPRE